MSVIIYRKKGQGSLTIGQRKVSFTDGRIGKPASIAVGNSGMVCLCELLVEIELESYASSSYLHVYERPQAFQQFSG